MQEVVIGLVSGLIGAALTAGVALLVGLRTLRQNARHEEGRRRERHRRARARAEYDARVMARVLLSDTVQARARLRSAERSGTFWSTPFAPSLIAWEQHKADVARSMPLEDWDVVSAWFRALANLEAYAAVARAEAPSGTRPPVGRPGEFVLKDALARSQGAAEVLGRFSNKTFTDEDEVPEV